MFFFVVQEGISTEPPTRHREPQSCGEASPDSPTLSMELVSHKTYHEHLWVTASLSGGLRVSEGHFGATPWPNSRQWTGIPHGPASTIIMWFRPEPGKQFEGMRHDRADADAMTSSGVRPLKSALREAGALTPALKQPRAPRHFAMPGSRGAAAPGQWLLRMCRCLTPKASATPCSGLTTIIKERRVALSSRRQPCWR